MFGNLFNNKSNTSLILLFLSLVILDQVTKSLVINNFDLYDSIVILPSVNLTFVVNYGFAFGLLNNPSLNQIFVSAVIFLIIIYFVGVTFPNAIKQKTNSFVNYWSSLNRMLDNEKNRRVLLLDGLIEINET